MAASDPKTELSNSLFFLRNAAPQQYGQAVVALQSYMTALGANVVDAAPDKVLLAQGHARQCRLFYDLLVNPEPPKQLRGSKL